MIEAVVFDLDGTALPTGEFVPSQKLIDAATRGRDKMHISAATGRVWDMTKPVVQALGLTDPCVVAGGTQIVDPQSGRFLWEANINPKSAQAVLDIIATHDFPFLFVCGKRSGNELDEFDIQEANIMYMLEVPRADVQSVEAGLAHIPGITVSKAAPSWGDPDGVDIHVTSNVATKEHAVRELAGLLGVPTSKMAGVGDGHNDLHLFNAVGHKVAMGNAVPELKARADEVIDSQDNDGLAKYIHSLC